MLPRLIRARPQLALQILLDFLAVARVNQAQRIQTSTLGIWA